MKYNRKFEDNESSFNNLNSFNSADQYLELNERKRIMAETLSKLDEPCHSILKLFYFDSYSMEAIATALNYKNADVVKSQKLRCINELRERINMKYKREDL